MNKHLNMKMQNLAVCALVSATMAVVAKAQESGKKCRALILSGGANNGAWEAGVIWGLLHYSEDANDFAWDVVTGVSAGAINTSGIATWATGTEMEMTEWLSKQWEDMTSEQVWVQRPGSAFDLLFKEPSVLDDNPGLETLRGIVAYKGEIARRFAVSAVDVNTGDYIPMTQEDTAVENLAQAAIASSSIPIIFPPTQMNGHVFMDGGTLSSVNLVTAVDQCMQIVDDYEDIIVDVAYCAYYPLPGATPDKNALKNWRHAKSMFDFYNGGDDLIWQAKAFPGL